MRWIVDLAVFVGVVAAIVLTLVFLPPDRGPYYTWQSDGGYSGIAAPLKAGQVITSGNFFEFPTLSTPVVLLAVRPLHAQDARGVTLRYGVWSGRMPFGGAPGWHPAKWQLHPVAGFVIPAHVEAGVMVGASSNEVGVHRIRGFIVNYRIGALTYSAPQQVGMTICVGTRGCPAP